MGGGGVYCEQEGIQSGLCHCSTSEAYLPWLQCLQLAGANLQFSDKAWRLQELCIFPSDQKDPLLREPVLEMLGCMLKKTLWKAIGVAVASSFLQNSTDAFGVPDSGSLLLGGWFKTSGSFAVLSPLTLVDHDVPIRRRQSSLGDALTGTVQKQLFMQSRRDWLLLARRCAL